MNAHRTTTASHLNRGAGIATIFAAGLLHAFITPEYVKEKLYIGASFGVSFVLCTLVAVWLWTRPARAAWIAGALLCAGMILGFLLSRTVGLPGFNESGVWAHWTEGFPALAAEIGFLALAIKPILAPAAPDAIGTALADPIARDRVLSSR
jgi:uncharacterized membrane protein YfcA